jgi:hypothetical protein
MDTPEFFHILFTMKADTIYDRKRCEMSILQIFLSARYEVILQRKAFYLRTIKSDTDAHKRKYFETKWAAQLGGRFYSVRGTKARVAKDQRLKEDASGKLLVTSRAMCLCLFT